MWAEEAHRQMKSASLLQEVFNLSFQKGKWTSQALSKGPHLNIIKLFLRIYLDFIGYIVLGIYPFLLGCPI